MSRLPKDYLGDSVYAEFDGYSIILTTENGYGPSNTIVLEPEVILALERFAARFYEMRDGFKKPKTPDPKPEIPDPKPQTPDP